MRCLRNSFVLLVLFMGSCILLSSCAQQDTPYTTATHTKSEVFAEDFAPGQLEAHFIKHKDEFSYSTQEEYLKGARQLLNSPKNNDILEKVRPNGDILHYNIDTGEFAVMTKEGRVRTYFKADYNYWMKQ